MYLQYTFFPNNSDKPVQEWCQLGLIDKMDGGYLMNGRGFTQINFDPKQLIFIGGHWIDLSKFPVRLDYLLVEYGENNFEITKYEFDANYYNIVFSKPHHFMLEYNRRTSICTAYSFKPLPQEFADKLDLINVSIA